MFKAKREVCSAARTGIDAAVHSFILLNFPAQIRIYFTRQIFDSTETYFSDPYRDTETTHCYPALSRYLARVVQIYRPLRQEQGTR